METKLIDLNKVANGGLSEMVNLEMKKVFENIADVNTKETAKRSITIQIEFTPDKKRSVVSTDISVKSRLASGASTSTNFLVGAGPDGKTTGGEMKSEIPGQYYINSDGEIADDLGNEIEQDSKLEKVERLFK